MRLGPGQKG